MIHKKLQNVVYMKKKSIFIKKKKKGGGEHLIKKRKKRKREQHRILSTSTCVLDQGYKKIRLIRSLKKFIFRYQYLVEIYSVSAEKIISDAFSYSENV